jgi:pyrimidine operon attenuation protein/uracil phosphoribosyltransferase
MPEVEELFLVDTTGAFERFPELLQVVDMVRVGRVHVLPRRLMVEALRRDLAALARPPGGFDVVCVGSGGRAVYEAVRQQVKARVAITVDARREFAATFDPCVATLDTAAQHIELPERAARALTAEGSLLLVDDVVYSGGTVEAVLRAIQHIAVHRRTVIACLVSLRTAEALSCSALAGLTCSRSNLWPAGRTELIDVHDLLSPTALRFRGGGGTSLLGWTALVRDQLFGDAYHPACALVHQAAQRSNDLRAGEPGHPCVPRWRAS